MTDLTAHVQAENFDLRDDTPIPTLPTRVRLKSEPKPVEPKLALANYIERDSPSGALAVPAAVHRSNLRFPYGMLANDQLGDCGEAMAIHAIEAFHLDGGTPVPPFGDPQAIELYSEAAGYVPGHPETDTGTDNQVLVDKWRDLGAADALGARHKIAGSLFVDFKQPDVLKAAIWEFVALFTALGLPQTAQTQTYWKLIDPSLTGEAAVGSWGYHDVPWFSYDSQRLRTVTWGQPWLADWSFLLAYTVQAFVVVTEEQLDRTGVSPSGVNWSRLNADLAQFPPQR